ncbi:MAG TPA: TetR/AcrR family transcriptional regulator [Gemmatimonadaceae bacterium]
MTPRPYTPVERQKAVDEGRERILAAGRELLTSDSSETFSIDAVARHAGVSRMTVYNQFESKPKLLEALFDSLAIRGPLKEMANVFAEPDPIVAFDKFIELFGNFWTYGRLAHGRLKAAAIIDPDLAEVIRGRNERRRGALAQLVKRLADHTSPVVPQDELLNSLFVLLSFDTFDAIAGPTRTPNDVVPIVRQMAYAVLGGEAPKPRPRRRAKRKKT